MANAGIAFKSGFVTCFETCQGSGPWSDEKFRKRLWRGREVLMDIFASGVPADSLYLEHAEKPSGIRRSFLPPKFGKIYAEFSQITPFSETAGAQSGLVSPHAYICILYLRTVDIWMVAAFLDAPKPTLNIIFAGRETLCQRRLGAYQKGVEALRLYADLSF